MATIQQLDRLHGIKRTFLEENTLESAVVCQRVDKIIARTEQMLQQRAFLREERRKLRAASEYLEAANKSVSLIKRPDWLPFSTEKKPSDGSASSSSGAHSDSSKSEQPVGLPPASSSSAVRASTETMRINMSGLMFEAPLAVLKRDPGCLLANLGAATAADGVREEDGVYYIERDWWLFRYLLAFLRDGTLPNETALLVALYREANFYRCNELQLAVEERKLHLRESAGNTDTGKSSSSDGADRSSDKDGKNTKKNVPAAWWKSLPCWYTSVDEVLQKQKQDAKAVQSKKDADWWLSTSYKGKSYVVKETKNEKK